MKTFNSKSALDLALCGDMSQIIIAAIAQNGQANVLLSGGSSPIHLYQLLSQVDLDWSKVNVGLVDERFVAPTDDFSNEKMIRATLLQHHGKSIRFFGMVSDENDKIENVQQIAEIYQLFANHTDLVLLGMGEDGHTASLFPQDEVSEALLTSTQIGVFNTNSPNFPNDRITCSAELLLQAKNRILMLSGEKKLAVYEAANANRLPISFFKDKLSVYYSI